MRNNSTKQKGKNKFNFTSISLRSMAVLVGRANKSGRAEKPWGDWGESNLLFSRRRRSFSRASRANFSASPLVRPARHNRHATQAN